MPDRRSTWVRFDELTRFFQEARAKHILVTMDCCYGGRLAATRRTEAEAYAERYLTRPAHVVIASGREMEQVSDGPPGGHSPFAEAFLEALRGGAGPLMSSSLFAGIQERFARSDVGHTPVMGVPVGSPVGGEFVFFREAE